MFYKPFIFFCGLCLWSLPVTAQEFQAIDLELEHGQLHAKVFGEGDPLLLINGGPGFNSDGFITLARMLSGQARVIIYDQRGTGQSTMVVNSSTMTIEQMIGDIERLREHLDIDRWIVMGHSFGGMLTYAYAKRHPEHIMGMIHSSSGGYNLDLLEPGGIQIEPQLEPTEWDSLNFWRRQLANGNTSQTARNKRAQYLAPAYIYNDSNASLVAERLQQGDMRINALIWNDLQRMEFDCEDVLHSFLQPVLIIHGKQDVVNPFLAKKAHDLLPNSNLVLLDRCGHYGWLDRPEKYFEEVFSFIEMISSFSTGQTE